MIVELLTRDHGRVGMVARGLIAPKRHPLRAALQPLQYIRVDYQARGELARLVQAEALDVAPALTGDRLMAAFYANELLLKLTPRNDAAQSLFELYARVRSELPDTSSLSWTLRRFERDLLDSLGVGLPWDLTQDGEQCIPSSRYRLDPELGPIAERGHGGQGVSGEALLALAADRRPSPPQLTELRRALRHVIESHLGSSVLRSWGLLDELARVRPTGQG